MTLTVMLKTLPGQKFLLLKFLLLKSLLLKVLLLNMSEHVVLDVVAPEPAEPAEPAEHASYPWPLSSHQIITARFGGQSRFPECFALLFGMCSGGQEVCVMLF